MLKQRIAPALLVLGIIAAIGVSVSGAGSKPMGLAPAHAPR